MNDPIAMTADAREEPIAQVLSAPRRVIGWVFEEVHWFARVLLSSMDRFYWDNSFSNAASLAYTTLLSLVPVTALVFGILAAFASDQDIDQVRKFVFGQFVPSTQAVDEVMEHLRQLNERYAKTGHVATNLAGLAQGDINVNVLAFGFLVFTSILLLNSIEGALNRVWQVFEPRTIANRVKIFSAILLVGPVLALSAYFCVQYGTKQLGSIRVGVDLNTLYSFLIQFLIDVLAFFGLYFLVPRAPVKGRSAIFGAFVASILFGGAKTAFVIYVERFASYSAIYGAVAAIPIFLIWLYLAWTIVLFGAEASYQAQYLPKKGKLWKRSILSVGDGLMLLGVQSLVIIGRAFQEGRRMPNDWEIAENLGCSSTVLKPALSALEHAAIIARGDSADMPLTLLRDPTRITLEEVRDAIFSSRNSMHYAEEMTRLFASFSAHDLADKVTLADILTSERSQPQ